MLLISICIIQAYTPWNPIDPDILLSTLKTNRGIVLDRSTTSLSCKYRYTIVLLKANNIAIAVASHFHDFLLSVSVVCIKKIGYK